MRELRHLRLPTPARGWYLVWAVMACLIGWLPSPAVAAEVRDPLEPMNRVIYNVNNVVDGLVVKPAAEIYGLVVPAPVKTKVRNFLDNLKAPVVLANDLLQGDRDGAGVTFSRFFINSVLGGLGIFDVASTFGYQKHYEDFGQTMGVWGVGDGFYLVLPLFGPSTARDAVGIVVDGVFFDPLAYTVPADLRIPRTVVDAVDRRYRLIPVTEDLKANSIDPYVTVRTVYLQRRAADIRNGAAPVADDTYENIFKEGLEPDADEPK